MPFEQKTAGWSFYLNNDSAFHLNNLRAANIDFKIHIFRSDADGEAVMRRRYNVVDKSDVVQPKIPTEERSLLLSFHAIGKIIKRIIRDVKGVLVVGGEASVTYVAAYSKLISY